MELKDVLLQARELVVKGWTQGALTNRQGDYCLQAAIGLSSGVYEIIDGRVSDIRVHYSDKTSPTPLVEYVLALRIDDRATQLVKHVLPTPYESIAKFNDSPDTTLQDVLDVLDHAISFEDAAAKVWAS